MVVLGLRWLYSDNIVVFGQSGCNWAKLVVFGQNGCIRTNMVVIGQGVCIRKKCFDSDKSV